MNSNQCDGLLALKLLADKQNFTAGADELRIWRVFVSTKQS
jgi:hypothetical protein